MYQHLFISQMSLYLRAGIRMLKLRYFLQSSVIQRPIPTFDDTTRISV